ncbi:MAG: site-specific DNA-methyltransferase [Verrucomicrobiae bacterium]|nr:site-specific DNA-methyltransferase [Verrucomicrobiae bacterium]
MLRELAEFDEFGAKSLVQSKDHGEFVVPTFTNEFWTAKQRAANNLHEVSYRACFKPQLPRFFIDRLTTPGDLVMDPFMGRGTTLVESALAGRRAAGADINPLSGILTAPRLNPPTQASVKERLLKIDFTKGGDEPEDLLTFYHPDTLREISALRRHLLEPPGADAADAWIRMVATNRLTGHSPGFFSVYTLPPNQAVTVARQKLINAKRNQTPPYRNVQAILEKKSKSLLRDITADDRQRLRSLADRHQIVVSSADDLSEIRANSVALVVTSPPFLDIVQYSTDNWLRCWFNGIDAEQIRIWKFGNVLRWQEAMARVFVELKRVLRPGGHVAFEVGEVRKGKIQLEDHVVPAATSAGLEPVLVLINAQEFTKTSNCWGVDNQSKGTNTNRIILLRKP